MIIFRVHQIKRAECLKVSVTVRREIKQNTSLQFTSRPFILRQFTATGGLGLVSGLGLWLGLRLSVMR